MLVEEYASEPILVSLTQYHGLVVVISCELAPALTREAGSFVSDLIAYFWFSYVAKLETYIYLLFFQRPLTCSLHLAICFWLSMMVTLDLHVYDWMEIRF